MKRIIIIWACTFSILSCWGQEQEVKAVVDKMFQSMYTGDTSAMRSCFMPGAKLMTYAVDKESKRAVHEEPLNEILDGISKIKNAELEERLISWQCLIDDGIASVWTPYEFYFNKQFSHCGVNSFQLVNMNGEWKISMITDTRRRNDCPGGNKEIMKI